nr:MAG TPA: hypothetical protein [Caudoviricetes sp.]
MMRLRASTSALQACFSMLFACAFFYIFLP